MHCEDDITGNFSETDTGNKNKEPEPPLAYIFGVTDYKTMVEKLF
jgi:hypothetical protein